MEAVVLCGVQGAGKTTFYVSRYSETHVRISLDMLGSREREAAFVALCLEHRQPFVVDNTNAAPADRLRFLEAAREAGFTLVGVLVESDRAAAQNAGRPLERRVPEATRARTARRLMAPTVEEGFDEVLHAIAGPEGGWRVKPLVTTPPLF